jgi:hypothetical protein
VPQSNWNNQMKHSRICAYGYRVAGGAQCACQRRRQAARPSASARGYGTDRQALRASTPHTPCTGCSLPWKAGYHLDHKLAAKLTAPMMRAIFIGSVTRATHVRRQNMMVALVTPCSVAITAFSFRRLHTRRVFRRPRPQRLPNSTAKTARLFLVHQRRLGPCVLRFQDLVGYFPHHQDGVLNRQRYEKSIASAGRINSGNR